MLGACFALVFELAAGAASGAVAFAPPFLSRVRGRELAPVAGARHALHAPALFAVGGGYSYGYGFPFYGSFAFNTVPFVYVPRSF